MPPDQFLFAFIPTLSVTFKYSRKSNIIHHLCIFFSKQLHLLFKWSRRRLNEYTKKLGENLWSHRCSAVCAVNGKICGAEEKKYSGNAFSINIFSRPRAINLKFHPALRVKFQASHSYARKYFFVTHSYCNVLFTSGNC